MAEEIKNYEDFGRAITTFYDRSIIDCYGYSKLENLPISTLLSTKCCELRFECFLADAKLAHLINSLWPK
ncbi:hypothetical protein XM79_c11854 [Vibrio vulnificus]|nr:hypothetical protein XM72_c11972 [Vibrio vulnificus]OQK42708.1 hypothetical protein XM74_c11835 [Vibrio vulnificus]OQK53779.1 hypothetical protein XM76_c11827 [Vibrio vulnificus]OQK63045.1 hypothetical protein XM78_c11878 [Vibrio vulnificus]OQK65237.1 hypothetical protein XM79_c11854 [Vibrio vulnificus]